MIDPGPGGELTCTQTTLQLNAVSGGNIDDFIYEWTTVDGNIASGDDALDPVVDAAGTYVITVIDTINFCTNEAQVVVTQDANVPVAQVIALDEINCYNNSISIDGNGSTQGANIIFEWTTVDGNFVDGTNTLEPTIDQGGVYTLTITDLMNDCVSTASITVDPDTLNPQLSLVPQGLITCAVTEVEIQADVNNASNNLSIQWSTQDGSLISGANSLNPMVDAPGTYILEVTNLDNGCSSMDETIVDDDLVLPIVDAGPPNTLTCGVLNVTLDGAADTGGAPLDFNWSTLDGNIVAGQFSFNPIVDEPGTYVLEVINTENGCVDLSEVLIDQDILAPQADAGPMDVINCYQSSVSLDGANSSQGAIYSYEWTTPDGNIVSGADGLNPVVDAPGTYTILVINQDNECESTAVVDVLQDIEYPDADAGPGNTLTCTETSLNLSGSTSMPGPPFSYMWDTPNGNIVSGETTLDPLIDEPGVYELTILNEENGCATSSTVTILENVNYPVVDAGSAPDLTCVVLSVELDGTNSDNGPEFTYEWTTLDGNIIAGANTLTPEVDEPGTYELLITNQDNSCASLATVEVTLDDLAPAAEAGPGVLLTCDDPMLSLNGSGSSVGIDYTYFWTTGDGNIVAGETGLNPQIDQPGTYEILVTNQINGCTSLDIVTVDQDNALPITVIADPEILTCDILTIQLDGNGSSVGTDIEYIWTTSDGNIVGGSNTLEPSVNAPGTYVLEILNNFTGCENSLSIEVDQNIVAPNAEAGGGFELTCAITSFDLSGTASGNSTDLSYLWSTTGGSILSGETSLMPTIDAPGIYTLLVTDNENGCTHEDQVLITEDVTPPTTIIATPGILTCAITTVELNGSGSSQGAIYQINWETNDGNIISGAGTLNPEVDQPGTYTLNIFNTENGCSESISVPVDQDIEDPIVDAGVTFVLPCFEDLANLNGSVDAGTGNLLIEWSTLDGDLVSGTNTLSPSIATGGTYFLQITNLDNGCGAGDEVLVTEDKPDNLDLISAEPPCYGDPAYIEVTQVTGGTEPYLYSVDGGESFQSSPVFDPLDPGSYDVLVQDANGCETGSIPVYLPEPIELDLSLDATVELQFGDSYQLNGIVNVPEWEITSITWTPSESLSCDDCLDPIATPWQTTDYELYVENENGCPAEAAVRIVVDKRPAVYIPNGFSPNGDGENDVFMIFAKDGTVAKVQKFLVFSRWGETVFQYYDFDPNNPAYGWDGWFRGEPMNPAVFAYFAVIEFIDGRVELFEGDVTLVR